MKTILKIAFSFFFLLSTFYLFSQVPQKFNYQGIARDAKGNPMAKQQLALKLSVLPTSDAIVPEYEEIQHVLTNEFGLYTLQIGNGTPVTGEMKTVKWETGNKYIKVAIDPKGGNEFVDAGTTQLLSVPYAIYADKAGMAKTTTSSDRVGSVSTSASGTGTVNFLTKFTAANTIYNSQLFDNGTNIGIGTTTPVAKIHINQNIASVQEHFRMQNLSATGAGRFTLYSNSSTNYSSFTKYGSGFAGSYAGLTGLYPFGNLLAFGNNGLAANDGLGRFLISTAGNAGISIFKSGTSKLKFHADFTTENVGIGGNAAPVSRVHLNNTDGTNMDLRLTNTTSGHTAIDGLTLTQNGNVGSLINRENGELQFGTNNIASMKLVPSGNLELTNQIKIAGGNPGIGKVLTSDTFGLASWQTITIPISNEWVTNGTDIYNSNLGNVGIGTNTPTSPLHIASIGSEIRLQNTALNTSLFIKAPFNGGTGGIGTDGNYELPFFTNNIERVVIKNDGNVGIGTNTPTSPLHVASPVSEIRLQNTATNTSLFIKAPFNGGTGGIGTDGNHELPFYTNNTERVVIKNDGKVGIGTNTPTSPLHLASPVSEIRLQNTALNTSLFITAPYNGGTGGIGTDGNYELPFFTNNIERVVIKNNGRVGIGTNTPTNQLTLSTNSAAKPTSSTWTISSDARLKTVDGNYTRGLADVLKLNTIKYHYNKGNARNLPTEEQGYGFVAQELQQVYPEAVKENEDGYLSVDFHPVLVSYINAFKEQQLQIDDLKKQTSEIDLLKKQNLELKTQNENIKTQNDLILQRLEALEKK